MRKIILFFLCFSSITQAALTPNFNFHEPSAASVSAPNYSSAFRQGMETGALPAYQLRELESLLMQNKIMEAKLAAFYAANPKLAKDRDERIEFNDLINRNSGLFSSKKRYLDELKFCANHKNKYCQRKLSYELMHIRKR